MLSGIFSYWFGSSESNDDTSPELIIRTEEFNINEIKQELHQIRNEFRDEMKQLRKDAREDARKEIKQMRDEMLAIKINSIEETKTCILNIKTLS